MVSVQAWNVFKNRDKNAFCTSYGGSCKWPSTAANLWGWERISFCPTGNHDRCYYIVAENQVECAPSAFNGALPSANYSGYSCYVTHDKPIYNRGTFNLSCGKGESCNCKAGKMWYGIGYRGGFSAKINGRITCGPHHAGEWWSDDRWGSNRCWCDKAD